MPISIAHVHLCDCAPSRIPSNIHCVAGANTFVRNVLVHSTDVHQLLFQKRSGLFYLALWREVESADEDINETVTIDLTSSAKILTVFNPVSASAPVAQGRGKCLTVNVSDALTVVVVDLECN